MAQAPPGAESRRAAGAAVVGGDQRGDRDQVVGVGGVPQPEHECDAERDQQGGAVEQPGEPGVELLHGPNRNWKSIRDIATSLSIAASSELRDCP